MELVSELSHNVVSLKGQFWLDKSRVGPPIHLMLSWRNIGVSEYDLARAVRVCTEFHLTGMGTELVDGEEIFLDGHLELGEILFGIKLNQSVSSRLVGASE